MGATYPHAAQGLFKTSHTRHRDVRLHHSRPPRKQEPHRRAPVTTETQKVGKTSSIHVDLSFSGTSGQAERKNCCPLAPWDGILTSFLQSAESRSSNRVSSCSIQVGTEPTLAAVSLRAPQSVKLDGCACTRTRRHVQHTHAHMHVYTYMHTHV